MTFSNVRSESNMGRKLFESILRLQMRLYKITRNWTIYSFMMEGTTF